MSERHLYGSDNQYKGSIDDDGRIYDRNHSLMGRIENGTVYDNCNIPRGRIEENGMLRDNAFHEVGQEYGTGFSSPGPRREMGRVRADILSDGRGRDYGAFHLLDRRYDTDPYDEDDGGSDDDDDCSGGDYCDDDRDDDVYVPTHRSGRSAGRGNMGNMGESNDPEASCAGCGCLALFAIGILTLLRLCS